jgi:hypothetical protein
MDASPIHTYKDNTPRTDITCKETHPPGQINDKKRKRQNDHDHEHTLNPFFRPFHATVSLNTGKATSGTLTQTLSAVPTIVREIIYFHPNSPTTESRPTTNLARPWRFF